MIESGTECFKDGKFYSPGFRFHPTDEELVLYYLKRKICRRKHLLDVIAETDVYKWDPEELPAMSKLKTGDRQWFFFSPKDQKYPNGARSNRATRYGYWKATGKDRLVKCNSRTVGLKKTLVFYRGRAPSGTRTNWVMHEYTIDEEELKRCQTAKDYYALYKVYEKSGPGPKNGEQYGAPFREEDWADDELGIKNLVDQETNTMQGNDIVPVDNSKSICPPPSPLHELEELMNRIADERIFDHPPAVGYGFDLDEYAGDETQSTLVNLSEDAALPPTSNMLQQCSQPNTVQPRFKFLESSTSHLQFNEALEVSSAPNFQTKEPRLTEEDFLEDFLEMDDLNGPEPIAENHYNPLDNLEKLQYDGFDGLTGQDLYQDSAPLLFEAVPGEFGQISQRHIDNFDGVINPTYGSYLDYLEDGAVEYQRQPHMSDTNEISGKLWTDDQRSSVVTVAEENQGFIHSLSSGVILENQHRNRNSCDFVNPPSTANRNESGEQDDGTDSWFSSAVWAFVESIPTTPASASESALVNRAFEQMSGFGRVRTSVKNLNVAAVNTSVTSRSSGKSWRGFFRLSFLGLVFAILWVLIGISVRLAC